MPLDARCEREVHEMHDALAGWLGGTVPDNDGTFATIADVLAPEFEIVSPDGETTLRTELLDGLRAGHGSRAGGDPPFDIRIENLRVRSTLDAHCLLTYEEHQRAGEVETARLSTAFFRETAPDETRNGVAWVHLHETWLPDGAPGEG